IPVYADAEAGGPVVTVPAGRIQRTGVRIATAERRVVAQPVRVPGTLALDERRVTVVATRSDAYVDRVEGVTTGDRVRRGQPLVHIYAPEINAAAAQPTPRKSVGEGKSGPNRGRVTNGMHTQQHTTERKNSNPTNS
ncbi:efflux RND transporter periplasmic adaptor subunit, partial [Methylobacterium radiotolerans]|uniref:efflux RND transporter periplasmic adaptor subunit n=1 Tax=Methylobacterium radiotolerans TaxID=31998 RepID=UPI001FD8EFD7